MATKTTLESVLSFAASLDPGEWRDAIMYHLEKLDFNKALIVCGEAVLDSLRRETDLSVEELKRRMKECAQLEKMEKMISCLARETREQRRAYRSQMRQLPPAI